MLSIHTLLSSLAAAAWLISAHPAPRNANSAADACAIVNGRQSLSPAVAGTLQYADDISHWSNASSLPSLCTAEPDTPEEIQQLFEIIKETRTPWAVKGIGHSNINDRSSTLGLQISLAKFNQIEISRDKKSVKVGPGVEWQQLYLALEPDNLIAVGGRTPTVGVAGLSLSGGYAWHTNEYGFAVDNILAADIVLPNGTFTTVSENHGTKIFKGLLGGVNGFGIVTSLTLKTYPTAQVWGGSLSLSGNLEPLIDALVDYSTTGKSANNPKAALDAQFFVNNGTATGSAILFYDGPSPPPGVFDAFINLPGAITNFKTQSFVQFVQTAGDVPTDPHNRGTWYSAPVKPSGWTRELIHFIRSQAEEFSKRAVANGRSGTAVLANMPPYGPQAYGHGRNGAWPHSSQAPFNTFNSLFSWSNANDDQFFFNLTVEFCNSVWNKAIELGVSAPLGQVFYPPNYAHTITPPEQIYGPNLGWLRALRREVDPADIISLTGRYF